MDMAEDAKMEEPEGEWLVGLLGNVEQLKELAYQFPHGSFPLFSLTKGNAARDLKMGPDDFRYYLNPFNSTS
jgi:hypothetical protein